MTKPPEEALADKVWWKKLGPGLITGAADDDPSGIGTYSQGGAQFGYDIAWTVLITYPLMVGIQLASARIGRITGKGLTENFSRFCPRWLVMSLVVLLVLANVINLGADLNAMGDSAGMLLGGSRPMYAIGFGVVSLMLQVFLPYEKYVNVLKWLTLSLLAYVGVGFAAHVDWLAALRSTVVRSSTGKRITHHHRCDSWNDHQPLLVLLASCTRSGRNQPRWRRQTTSYRS